MEIAKSNGIHSLVPFIFFWERKRAKPIDIRKIRTLFCLYQFGATLCTFLCTPIKLIVVYYVCILVVALLWTDSAKSLQQIPNQKLFVSILLEATYIKSIERRTILVTDFDGWPKCEHTSSSTVFCGIEMNSDFYHYIFILRRFVRWFLFVNRAPSPSSLQSL